MRSNKLSVNIKKTNYVVFKPAQKKTSSDLQIVFNNQILKEQPSVKFLGIHIDNILTWKTHISPVCKKASKVACKYRAFFYSK